MSGTEGIPTPRQMFPEPASPFSKEAFNSSFDNAKKTAAAEGVIYKPEGSKKLMTIKKDDGTTT